MASITFDSENFKKKKSELTSNGINSLGIIPPSYFKSDNNKFEVQELEVALSKTTIPSIAKEDSKTVQTSPKRNKETKAKIDFINRSTQKKICIFNKQY